MDKMKAAIEWEKSWLRGSSRFPTLSANLGEHTCCFYVFAPIAAKESNSDIPFLIASTASPSPRMK
jgi:hypothetical protein